MSEKQRKKTRLGSYKFVSVLFSITLSLLMIGIFGVVLIQAKMLTRLIRENIEVQVFLSKNLNESEVNRLLEQVEEKPYVVKKEAGSALRFTSREEAAKLFMEEIGEDFTEFLDENPLRDSFTFSINEEFQTEESIASMVDELEQLPGVFEVTYMQDMVTAINENLLKVSLVLGTMIFILLFTVMILVSNTIKLALFSQRFLIRSMQLVGATKGFIRRPFLWRSFFFGTLAGVIASAIIFSLLAYGRNFIEGFQLLYDTELLALLFGSLILLGALLSWLSTFRSINKYLNMSLDELY